MSITQIEELAKSDLTCGTESGRHFALQDLENDPTESPNGHSPGKKKSGNPKIREMQDRIAQLEMLLELARPEEVERTYQSNLASQLRIRDLEYFRREDEHTIHRLERRIAELEQQDVQSDQPQQGEGEIVTLTIEEYSELTSEIAHWREQAESIAHLADVQVAELTQQRDDAREQAHRSEEMIAILRDRLDRVDTILRIETKNMGPSEKLAFIKIDRLTGGTVDNQGSKFIEISVADVGKAIGMSRGTAGDNIQKLAMRGFIAREADKEHIGKGQCFTHISVARTLFTDRPQDLQVAEEVQNNQGGTRVTCEGCGSENVNIHQAYECRDCGHISQAKLVKKQTGWRKKLPSRVNLTHMPAEDNEVEGSVVVPQQRADQAQPVELPF